MHKSLRSILSKIFRRKKRMFGKPDECLQKVLLSTRSRIVGEYSDTKHLDMLVTHAWQEGPEMTRALTSNPYTRNYYIVVFKTKPIVNRKGLTIIPTYSYEAESIANILSVFYGKQFISHGLIEATGLYKMPVSIEQRPTNHYNLPYCNFTARSSPEIPLDFRELGRIMPVFSDEAPYNVIKDVFLTAAQFYSRGLAQIEHSTELAYIDFVTCGEIISNQKTLPDKVLYDKNLLKILSTIEKELENGEKVASSVKNRLYQVRQRFSFVLSSYLDEKFFDSPEVKTGPILKPEGINQRLKAAYDLRSLYTHTGRRFGKLVLPPINMYSDVCIGEPVIDDKDFKKTIMKAPTVFGLERIMRYTLLKLADEMGASVNCD